jgi:hypothetical protein
MAVLQENDSCVEHKDGSMWYSYHSNAWQCDFCYDNFWESMGLDRKWTDRHELDT